MIAAGRGCCDLQAGAILTDPFSHRRWRESRNLSIFIAPFAEVSERAIAQRLCGNRSLMHA
jgi:hypothetical protein